MKCEDFGRFLDNYENLTDAEKTEMTDHAAMCEKCKQELDFFLSMLAVTKSLPKIEPPADFMATLNERLDAEDKKPSPNKIVYHVRKNWKQYTSLAACLALVAVITANRGILLDRIEGNEDGVITEDSIGSGDSAARNDKTTETAVVLPADTPVSDNAAAMADSASDLADTSVRTPEKRQAGAYTSVASRSRNTELRSSVSEASSSIQTKLETPEAVSEKVNETQPELEASKSGDYGIALRGAIQSVTETASVEYDMTLEEASASLRASKVIDSYSLAGGGESIALGRYYSIDADGKPIMEDIGTQAAIGSLKIDSEDADKAMEVLSQYPHDESGNVYTTGSDTVSEILSDLSDEGVTYTDYIIGGSDAVKFKIEFN